MVNFDLNQDVEPPDIQQQQQVPDPRQVELDYLNQRNQGDRNRLREDERNLPPEVKLTAPTFAGKIDPAAYLE